MPTAAAIIQPSRALSVLLRAAAWGLGLFGVLRLPWMELHAVWPVTRLQGQLAAAMAGVAALPVDVTLACSGTDVLAMSLGAVLAYPARRAWRVAGVAGAAALILALNIIRIATLGRAAASPLFDVLHLYVWPAMLAVAASGFVFGWMRMADAAPRHTSRERVARPTRRFVCAAAAFIVIFAAASPWYLSSAWVLAAAAFIARAAAGVLRAAGIAAVASDNVLVTARGGITVTQECIATPLIPVYLAAVVSYVPSWRLRAPALLAVVPIFIALGILRLLVVAGPAALIGSPLFFIHAFYQLLTGIVVIAAAAYWRHGAAAGSRRAAAGIAAGIAALALLAPIATRVLAIAAPFDDPQGALALLPAFQIALLLGLWTAVWAPARWRVLVLLTAVMVASQAILFIALQAGGGFAMLAAHVPAVRAWAVAAPLACLAIVRLREHSHD